MPRGVGIVGVRLLASSSVLYRGKGSVFFTLRKIFPEYFSAPGGMRPRPHEHATGFCEQAENILHFGIVGRKNRHNLMPHLVLYRIKNNILKLFGK